MKNKLSLILPIFLTMVVSCSCDVKENISQNTNSTMTEIYSSDTSIEATTTSVSITEQNTSTEPTTPTQNSTSVVVYFSCTGNTKKVANTIAEVTNSDIFEIFPAVPYTDEDLNYNDDKSRVNYENNDDAIRPEIAITFENLEDYDTIYLGYPIWWGQAPKILYTFVESYDFTGKDIVPFCTSGSSDIGNSAYGLESVCNGSANWLQGRRFSSDVSTEEISNWIDSIY